MIGGGGVRKTKISRERNKMTVETRTSVFNHRVLYDKSEQITKSIQ